MRPHLCSSRVQGISSLVLLQGGGGARMPCGDPSRPPRVDPRLEKNVGKINKPRCTKGIYRIPKGRVWKRALKRLQKLIEAFLTEEPYLTDPEEPYLTDPEPYSTDPEPYLTDPNT